jgi:hypothetical protein
VENGTITAYDEKQGRGTITLASGAKVPFEWYQVQLPINMSAFRNCNVGHGHYLPVGTAILYDRNAATKRVSLP